MSTSAEHDTSTATRILIAARELVLKRGVKGLTVADIAERAHVGKGTAYLYWGTKEDLLFGLFARDFLAVLDREIDALGADPELARPHRLCSHLVLSALDNPFVRAVQLGDADVLGGLAKHPRSMDLLEMLGPAALMYAVLPVWRRHTLARTDWPVDEQAYALQALMTGFLETATRAPSLRSITVDSPDNVVAAAVTALLGPERASRAQLTATAEEGLSLLAERRQNLLALITTHEAK
jgi:AcrR family transcriptional regulator